MYLLISGSVHREVTEVTRAGEIIHVLDGGSGVCLNAQIVS